MSVNKPIQLGLCCLNIELRDRKPSVYCSRRMIIRSIEMKGIAALKTKIIYNLKDLLALISWNEENKITEFKVIVRPLQAVNKLHQQMQNMLERMKA